MSPRQMRRSALVEVPASSVNMRRAFCVLIMKLGAVHAGHLAPFHGVVRSYLRGSGTSAYVPLSNPRVS